MFGVPPSLKIDVRHVPHACVVRLQGELDIAECPALEDALEEAERSQADRLIIDIDKLTLIDSTGLGVLFNASHRSASNGNRLQITRGKGQVARVLRVTGLDKTLPITDAWTCPGIEDVGADGRRTLPVRAETTSIRERRVGGAARANRFPQRIRSAFAPTTTKTS